MANLSASLILSLTDDVSGPAKKVATALKSAQDQVKALSNSGVTNRLGQQLSKLGLNAKDIERVGAAWKSYASSAGLAGSATNWTKGQVSQVKQWVSFGMQKGPPKGLL